MYALKTLYIFSVDEIYVVYGGSEGCISNLYFMIDMLVETAREFRQSINWKIQELAMRDLCPKKGAVEL